MPNQVKSVTAERRSTRLATALITGATGGIGFHTAAALARAGMHVMITGRDDERGRKAVLELQASANHVSIDLMIADAFSIRANVGLANDVARRVGQLDVLINNVGGVGAGERRETPEGLEATLALNFAGPFALTNELLRVLPVPPRRIVNVVSSAFKMWKRDPFEDLDARLRYIALDVHAHAKLLNLLVTLALARRLAGTKSTAVAVNPGMAWTPGLAALTPQAVPRWRFIWPLVRSIQRRASAESAARAVAILATTDGAELSGRYYDGHKNKQLPLRLRDPVIQDRAWALGESLAARATNEASCP